MLKLGVTGLGYIANREHLPCLTQFKDVELYCCDAWQEPRERCMKDFGIPPERMFSNLDDMIQKVHPDAIYLLVPQYNKTSSASAHGSDSPYEPMVNQVLEAGLPLFVEKPLGVDAAQARRITEKARQCGVKITMCGFQRRFNPLLRHAMKLIAEQGPLLSANFSFFKGLSEGVEDEKIIQNHNWLTFDLVHVLDVARWLPHGKLVSWEAAAHHGFGSRILTAFDVLFNFDNNVSSHFTGNVRVGGRFLRFELHGCGISIFISTVPPGEHNMTAWIFRQDPVNHKNKHLYTPEPEVIRVEDVAPAQIQPAYSGFWGEARHFCDCVAAGIPTESSFESALETIEMCDAILNKSSVDRQD